MFWICCRSRTAEPFQHTAGGPSEVNATEDAAAFPEVPVGWEMASGSSDARKLSSRTRCTPLYVLNAGFQPKTAQPSAYGRAPARAVPSKVPAPEKLLPFPQPLGVSYGYGSVGVGAGERQSWELRAGRDEFNAHSGGCRSVGPRDFETPAGAGRAGRGYFRDPDHPRALRPCCRLAAAG